MLACGLSLMSLRAVAEMLPLKNSAQTSSAGDARQSKPDRNQEWIANHIDSPALNFPGRCCLKATGAWHGESAMTPLAQAAPQPDARQAAMTAVSAAAIEMHAAVMQAKPEWFWHMMRRCEAKAAKIAEQASHGPHANGEATFIEVYAKTLPTLFTAAMAAYEQALNDNS
jgi:hypothetical protein